MAYPAYPDPIANLGLYTFATLPNAANYAPGSTEYSTDRGLVYADNAGAWQPVGVGSAFDPNASYPDGSVGAVIDGLLGDVINLQGTAGQIIYTLTDPTTNTYTSSLASPLGPIPLQGFTDASSAAAGVVGEYMDTGALPAGQSLVTTVANTAATTSNLVLTTGEWHVFGQVVVLGTATSTTSIQCGLSTVAATLPNADWQTGKVGGALSGAAAQSLVFTPRRFLVTAATQQVFPAVLSTFSGGTAAAAAFMWAWRVR